MFQPSCAVGATQIAVNYLFEDMGYIHSFQPIELGRAMSSPVSDIFKPGRKRKGPFMGTLLRKAKVVRIVPRCQEEIYVAISNTLVKRQMSMMAGSRAPRL